MAAVETTYADGGESRVPAVVITLNRCGATEHVGHVWVGKLKVNEARQVHQKETITYWRAQNKGTTGEQVCIVQDVCCNMH